MMTASMMRDRYYTIHPQENEPVNECICGSELHEESNYINNQGKLVTIMVCDDCGKVEHWIENCDGLIECK